MPSKSNEYAYESGRTSSCSVGTTSVQLLAPDAKRRYALICNAGSGDCFLAIGTPALAGRGILLKANGGAYEMLAHNLTHAGFQAITASGTTSLAIQEGL